jgi:hypothetical protein
MEITQKLILKFLDKNYTIIDGMILDKYNYQIWFDEILVKIPKIFYCDKDYSELVFIIWCEKYGINDYKNEPDFKAKQLNVMWNPEMAQEIAAFHHIDAEAELTAMLANQIADEINSQIIRDLKDSIKKKV